MLSEDVENSSFIFHMIAVYFRQRYSQYLSAVKETVVSYYQLPLSISHPDWLSPADVYCLSYLVALA